jgi:hypothetical protein
VFQNPELFPTQVSLSPEQSTLVAKKIALGIWFGRLNFYVQVFAVIANFGIATIA